MVAGGSGCPLFKDFILRCICPRRSPVGRLLKCAEAAKSETPIVCSCRTQIGEASTQPITPAKTQPGANGLLAEGVGELRRALLAGRAEYEKEATAPCRDIRVVMQRLGDAELLAGIVRNPSPDKQTKNKIECVAVSWQQIANSFTTMTE